MKDQVIKILHWNIYIKILFPIFFKKGGMKVIFLFCGSSNQLLVPSLLGYQEQKRFILLYERVKFIVNNACLSIPFECFFPLYAQQFSLAN